MRAEPSHRAEMVNQALFGEAFEIVDRKNEWTHIRLGHDGYMGWVLDRQIQGITHESYRRLVDEHQALVDLVKTHDFDTCYWVGKPYESIVSSNNFSSVNEHNMLLKNNPI